MPTLNSYKFKIICLALPKFTNPECDDWSMLNEVVCTNDCDTAVPKCLQMCEVGSPNLPACQRDCFNKQEDCRAGKFDENDANLFFDINV